MIQDILFRFLNFYRMASSATYGLRNEGERYKIQSPFLSPLHSARRKPLLVGVDQSDFRALPGPPKRIVSGNRSFADPSLGVDKARDHGGKIQ